MRASWGVLSLRRQGGGRPAQSRPHRQRSWQLHGPVPEVSLSWGDELGGGAGTGREAQCGQRGGGGLSAKSLAPLWSQERARVMVGGVRVLSGGCERSVGTALLSAIWSL